jgi:hypothetical protein
MYKYQDIQHTGGENEKKLSSELQETLDLATTYPQYLQSHLPSLLRYPLERRAQKSEHKSKRERNFETMKDTEER